MVAFIVFLTCLQLTVSQDCESGDVGSIIQLQRQEREDLGTVFAQTPVVTRSFDPPLSIPDGQYNGKKPDTEEGARCVTFDVPDVPGANSMSVQLALNHTWVSDTVIFIKNHRGHVTVLKFGNTNPGSDVDLRKDIPITFITSASRPAKQMGDTAVGTDSAGNEIACKMAPEQCSFEPEPPTPLLEEPGTEIRNLNSLAVEPEGTWAICIGDDLGNDQGYLFQFNLWIPAFDPNNAANGDAVGDPHIDTLEGEHYLLSKQGTFSLWELSGLDAEIQANHVRKQVPIDFKVYAHYSGHASYTKALLLLDQAANAALEITAKDCHWRWRSTATGWSAVDASQQLLSVPDADGDHMTGLEVDGKNRIKFLMKEAHGSWQDLGNLSVRCKPGHFLNTKLSMPQRHIHLAGGQLGGHREGKKDSQTVLMQGTAQQGRTDQEFRASKTWSELGGSAEADFYLKSVDEQQGEISLVSTACSKSQLEEARGECEKHFGEAPDSNEVEANHFANAVESCAYDRCHGADEIAMELAAEIWLAD